MSRSLAAPRLALATLAVCSSACMTSPYHGQTISDRSDAVTFNFYATSPNATVTIDCGPGYFDPYQNSILTFTSVTSPTTIHGETVYYAGGSRVVPSSCWDHIHGSYMTRLRPKQDGRSMRVYDQAGLNCIGSALRAGDGPITAGSTCALTYSNSSNYLPYVRIFASN